MTKDNASLDLCAHINVHIKAQGPMSLATYMSLALTHPTLGYYKKSDPLGKTGDFVTAPEISQMFGEMIGVWVAQTTQQFAPDTPFNLVELGPGRGTLMADALRVLSKIPQLTERLEVHLVETNPALIEKQRDLLGAATPVWHREIDALHGFDGPMIIIANEFFDALPIKQFQKAKGKWHERLIGLEGDKRVWGLSPSSLPNDAFPNALQTAKEHAVFESGFAAQHTMNALARLVALKGGALLAIDYGYGQTQTGNTLQALTAHQFVDPLDAPGDADITAHVDFEALQHTAISQNIQSAPLITQGDFLTAMGIEQRAEALANASSHMAEKIQSDLKRLIAPDEMGNLFKVACFYDGIHPPYPFTSSQHAND